MKKFFLLISLICLSSCVNQKLIEAKANHQAKTGDRLNKAQQNTEGLFDEMQ
jgi:hypothetical protein